MATSAIDRLKAIVDRSTVNELSLETDSRGIIIVTESFSIHYAGYEFLVNVFERGERASFGVQVNKAPARFEIPIPTYFSEVLENEALMAAFRDYTNELTRALGDTGSPDENRLCVIVEHRVPEGVIA